MTPRHLLSVAAVAAALTAAGCGDGKDTPTTAGVATPTASTSAAASSTPAAADAPATRAEAAAGQTGFDPQTIYRRESPGVVTIISAGLKSDGPASGGGPDGSAGLGSGFVISKEGEVATNAHVVTSGEGARISEAERVYVKFSDGNEVDAKVVGYDPFADVALLKIDPSGLDLRPLPFGSVKNLQVGAPVAAIGSPFGEEQSLSVGVISATGRSIESLTGFSTTGAIQTDAAINHGNSGGPLLDSSGDVLGINSQIRTDSGDGSGVGFAVPVDVVKRSIDQLRASGKVTYAYLGVSSRGLYPQVARRFDLPTAKGVWVQVVPGNGPAADAGIRGGSKKVTFQELPWTTGGDIIVGVGDRVVQDDTDLSDALLDYKPGDTVALKIFRDGKRTSVDVKLGERPLTTPRG